MDLTVRPYRPGDEHSISALLTRNTPYLRDNPFWIWINRVLPASPSLVAVLVDKNNHVQGHTAILPFKIRVGQRIIPCGMSCHTLIDQYYRDSDMIMPLLDLVDKLAGDAGLEFQFGFPNKNARPMYKLPDRYKVAKFLALEMDSCNAGPKEESSRITFEPIDRIDYDFLFSLNQILDSMDREKVAFARNLDYYCARYFFHPQRLYISYRIFYEGALAGCVVTKHYEKEGKNYFHILDLFLDTCVASYELILSAIISYFSASCDIFSFWKINEGVKKVLLSMGFQENGFDTFLGIRLLPGNRITEEEKSLLLDFRNWRLVMGDSDAF